jgi:hypothetical protein
MEEGIDMAKSRAESWRDFEEARDCVRGLGLQSATEWRKYLESGDKPRDIPANPSTVYADDWLGWGDWLGTGRIADQKKVWRDFEDAREFVRSLGIKSKAEWNEYSKSGEKPDDIPKSPQAVYRDRWRGYGDWLGTGQLRGAAGRPFEEAREYVRSLGVESLAEWRAFAMSGDKPKDIPSNPDRVYKAEWVGWGYWLGTGNVRNADKQFRSFEEAREFVRSLGLQDYEEWCEYSKSGDKPPDIPAAPNIAYRDKWRGYGDWLGTAG